MRRRPSTSRSTLAAAVLAAFAALAVPSTDLGAAGLGRLTVQSALGQPLRAEVEVTSLSALEAQSLAARLASPDAFAQAGLQFSPALSGLQLSVEARGGRTMVRITSSQPINEPFVDLLLELSWNGGKLLREYTFLLDPPSVAAPANTAGAPDASSGAQPAQAGSLSRTAPARAGAGTSQAGSAAQASSSGSRGSADPASTPPSSTGMIEVRRGDTLSAIAGRVKPATATLDQAMIALYQANPNAFAGNINLLRSGGTLIVPDAASMTELAPEEARSQVRMQSADFASYRRQLAGLAPTVAAAPSGATASGSVSARVQEGGAPAPGTDRLRLSRPEAQAAAGGSSGNAVGRSGNQSSAAEQAIARDAALRESQSRLEALERNVDDLKKLLELRNRAMADLQVQLDEARAASKSIRGAVGTLPEPSSSSSGTTSPSSVATPASTGVTSPAPSAPAASPTPASDPSSSSAPATSAVSTPSEPVSPTAGSASEPAKDPAAATAPAPSTETKASSPAAAVSPPSQPDFLDELLDNPLLLPALGGVAALGGGYALYAIRRRRRVERFEDSLIAADALAPNSLFGATGGQNVDTRQVDLPADGPATQIQATEVDPIEEANVYVAYGREAQAEDILREGMKRNPERHAIRHRLLELYAARSDRPAFEALARELQAITAAQGEDWEKACTLGLSIDPDNPLYAAAESSQFADPVPLEVPDLDFRIDELDAQRPLADSPAQTEGLEDRASSGLAPLELDLDLDLPKEPLDPARPQDTARADFGATSDSLLARVPDLPDSLDLDLDLAALEAISRIESPTAPNKNVAPLSDLGIDLDLDGGPAELRAEGAENISDSARWQEMATKLDLASAYEEIGDKEGARELLQEVMAGGDAQQQTKAREMLAKLA